MLRFLKNTLRTILTVLAILALAAGAIQLWSLTLPPIQTIDLASHPDPAMSYEAAVARFDALLASDRAAEDLEPECLPVLLTHGHKTARVIILMHSLTACPDQYHELAGLFYDEGYNVFIPRLPHHGMADRTSNALRDLTAEELLAAMDANVDLASGLGDRISVSGLSMGAMVTILAGQLRPDVDLAAPMSPALGLRFIPEPLTPAIARVLLGLPDFYIWWDPIHQGAFLGRSGYPGFSSHALGQILRLGLAERDLAQRSAPQAQNLMVITSWGEPAINLEAADGLAQAWRDHGADVQVFRFPLWPWLPHDILSTDAPFQRTELVYPELVELLTR